MRHIAFRATAENYLNAKNKLRLLRIPYEEQDHVISESIYFEDPDGYQLEITTYRASVRT
jgi:catechol-2,3-dioxygenase